MRCLFISGSADNSIKYGTKHRLQDMYKYIYVCMYLCIDICN